MSRTYSAGIATAYGAAVAGGYTGTYEEWCALMADYANVGERAAESATEAAESATKSESWAVGGTDTRTGEDTNNASYYAGEASDSALAAYNSAEGAAASATESESYAKGGTDSRPGEDTDNAQYYAGQAGDNASAASDSASAAAGYATLAESWAVGGTDSRTGEDTDNASYYATQASNSAAAAAASAESAAQSDYDATIIAPAYDATKTYAVGDYVTHSGKMYRCNTAITTAEVWTAAHWTEVSVGGEVVELKSALDFTDEYGILDIGILEKNGETTIEPVYVNYALNSSTGKPSSVNSKRISTKNLIYIPEGSSFSTELNDTATYYNFTRFCFDKNKQFISSVTSGLADGTYYVRLLTSRKDNGDITPQEVASAFTIKLTKETPYNLIESIKDDVGIQNVDFTPVVGKYINGSGEEKTSSSFNRSGALAVQKGTIIKLTATGYNTAVSMISTSNQSETVFESKVVCIDSTQRIYTFVADEDCYIVVSYDKSKACSLVFYLPSSNDSLNNRVGTIEDSNVVFIAKEADIKVDADGERATVGKSGYYIGNGGALTSSANFNVSAEITMSPGETIMFNATGYNHNVSVLAKANQDSTYTPLVTSTDSNEHTFAFLAEYSMNVVISSTKSTTVKYSIFGSKIGMIESKLNKNFVAFATMGVIGDSLASGASNYDGGASDRKRYAWGKYIEREHGIDVSLFSSGGATTRSWLEQPYGLAALNNADPLDCYIIGLGVNDAYSLGSSYLGAIADVHVGNESQNADTYYGNYSKIIAAIKAKSPRAKIICLTNPRGTASPQTDFNSAIADIVGLYANTYLIDLVADSFYTSADFKDTWYGAHSTAVGYGLIANNIYTHINDLIHGNLSDFSDIQWIVENHD